MANSIKNRIQSLNQISAKKFVSYLCVHKYLAIYHIRLSICRHVTQTLKTAYRRNINSFDRDGCYMIFTLILNNMILVIILIPPEISDKLPENTLSDASCVILFSHSFSCWVVIFHYPARLFQTETKFWKLSQQVKKPPTHPFPDLSGFSFF